MTMLRQPYYELSPEIYNALVQASKALENCALEPTLTELIYLRVSQINGCAFCPKCTVRRYANPVLRRPNWTRWQAGG